MSKLVRNSYSEKATVTNCSHLSTDIDSEIRLFADDCVTGVFYREIRDAEDSQKLQNDIDRLGCWE